MNRLILLKLLINAWRRKHDSSSSEKLVSLTVLILWVGWQRHIPPSGSRCSGRTNHHQKSENALDCSVACATSLLSSIVLWSGPMAYKKKKEHAEAERTRNRESIEIFLQIPSKFLV